MSAIPRQSDSGAYAGLRMNADEFLRIGDTPDRYELIDGVVVMSPSPSYQHQKVMALLFRQLDRHAEPIDADLVTDTDLRLADNLVYRPDILYFSPRRVIGFPQTVSAVPDLVIEILSPTSRPRDLITKRNDYERFGVGEYWVVDAHAGTIRAFQRAEVNAPFNEQVVTGDTLASSAVPGFVLDLRPIRRLAGH